jgi:signal transduction histidine kinase
MFIVLGLALTLLALRRHVVVAQAAAIGLLLLSLLNLAGYAARGTSLYLSLPGRGTSILTTLAVMALAFAALAALPHAGIMRALSADLPSAPVARRMLLATFAVPLLLAGGAMAALQVGFYEAGSALPLLAWAAVVLFTLLMWRFALQLHEVDMARAQVQQELRAALDELHAEHERKDVFLAMLAHELRNPLAPIRAAADVLSLPSQLPPERQRNLGGIIGRQVDQLVRMVDDLMDVSRVNRGQVQLDLLPLDMHAVVDDACLQARPLVERKRQQLTVDMAARPLFVSGDQQRLVQVIANLLNNAAKYTPVGGAIGVHLSAAPESVVVMVSDNGSGISPEMLPRVFDVFAQAAPGNPEGGLGLGLALVKRLVELHHGTVHAQSDGPGRGSTFTVTLPRVLLS